MLLLTKSRHSTMTKHVMETATKPKAKNIIHEAPPQSLQEHVHNKSTTQLSDGIALDPFAPLPQKCMYDKKYRKTHIQFARYHRRSAYCSKRGNNSNCEQDHKFQDQQTTQEFPMKDLQVILQYLEMSIAMSSSRYTLKVQLVLQKAIATNLEFKIERST